MRLWSLHPAYLDARGLTALWREALLAQAVLRGRTEGYRSHPQLDRFREQPSPLGAIASYLLEVRAEATRRGYRFLRCRIGRARAARRIPVTVGQLKVERRHLLKKLSARAPGLRARLLRGRTLPHPLFRAVPGRIAAWEKSRF